MMPKPEVEYQSALRSQGIDRSKYVPRRWTEAEAGREPLVILLSSVLVLADCGEERVESLGERRGGVRAGARDLLGLLTDVRQRGDSSGG
jgi:hypothetical protein